MRLVRVIWIELIILIKCKWQISSLTIFEGNQFLVKKRHIKWNRLNRASQYLLCLGLTSPCFSSTFSNLPLDLNDSAVSNICIIETYGSIHVIYIKHDTSFKKHGNFLKHSKFLKNLLCFLNDLSCLTCCTLKIYHVSKKICHVLRAKIYYVSKMIYHILCIAHESNDGFQ